MADKVPDWAAQLRQVFNDLPGESGARPSLSEYATDLARDLAEERAAIMEYDGGMSRRNAEVLADLNPKS